MTARQRHRSKFFGWSRTPETVPNVDVVKTCPKCGTEKLLNEFHRDSHSKDGLQARCKICKNAESAVWRAANPERVKFHNAAGYAADPEKSKVNSTAWRAVHPEKRRIYERRALLKKHGITLEQYDTMFDAQDGRCAICGTDNPRGPGNILHVDHCHNTGVVRGLLCHHCNIGIGNLGDDPKRVMDAAVYLLRTAPVSNA